MQSCLKSTLTASGRSSTQHQHSMNNFQQNYLWQMTSGRSDFTQKKESKVLMELSVLSNSCWDVQLVQWMKIFRLVLSYTYPASWSGSVWVGGWVEVFVWVGVNVCVYHCMFCVYSHNVCACLCTFVYVCVCAECTGRGRRWLQDCHGCLWQDQTPCKYVYKYWHLYVVAWMAT